MSPPRQAGPTVADFEPSNTGPQSEAEIQSLLSGARRGDRQSIGELLTQYRKYLMLLATTQIQRRLAPRVSPSDVVQETMLRAHRHFAQFQGHTERELLGWLREILVTSLARFVEQHMLAAKRDIRREVSMERLGADMERSTHFAASVGPSCQSPSVQAQNREEAVVLADLLAQLPEHYREVLVLRNIQGLSFEEVAGRLDRSIGATRMLWLRGIEKLRSAYRREKQHGS